MHTRRKNVLASRSKCYFSNAFLNSIRKTSMVENLSELNRYDSNDTRMRRKISSATRVGALPGTRAIRFFEEKPRKVFFENRARSECAINVRRPRAAASRRPERSSPDRWRRSAARDGREIVASFNYGFRSRE